MLFVNLLQAAHVCFIIIALKNTKHPISAISNDQYSICFGKHHATANNIHRIYVHMQIMQTWFRKPKPQTWLNQNTRDG